MTTPKDEVDLLKIGRDCRLEYVKYRGVTLCYTERSPDHWYSDTETEVDIDREQAAEIVAWLCEKYQMSKPYIVQ